MSSTDAREQPPGAAAEEPTATGGTVPAVPPGQSGGRLAGGHVAAGHRSRRGRWVAAGVVLVLVLAGAGAALATGAFGTLGRGHPGSSAGGGYRTGTATVTRRSLSSQSVVNATLGKAGTWSVVVPQSSSDSSSSSSAGGSGTITWLPRVGRTVYQGQRIYAVSGTPVVLLYGNVPAYQDLAVGVTGADVTDLNAALVGLGYATRAALGPRSGWDYYSAETAYAVGQLQARLGLAVTGTLSLGEAVFLPGPALVTAWGTTTVVGSPATPGTVVLTASSTIPVVTIALDAGQQSEVKAGDPVTITLPDGTITPGVISQVSRVATTPSSGNTGGAGGSAGGGTGSGGSAGTGATVTVLAVLKHPKAAGRLNQAPVTVTITTASVAGALTVPVDALLAVKGDGEAGGRGYAVEVTGPGGHHLVTVTPGLFDDAAGLVQVTGNLAPGQHVVVPGL